MYHPIKRAFHAVDSTPVTARARRRAAVFRPILLLLALALSALSAPPALAYYPGGCPGVCGPWATNAEGQTRINQGRYEEAIVIFTCVIAGDPLSVDAYRGRIEATLLLGRYSDAVRDYARLTADVLPERPDAAETIFAGYDARLAQYPSSVQALTGASFARWWFFDYPAALPLLQTLLTLKPNNVYGNLFRGSNRLFVGESVAAGQADLARAIQLAPWNPHVRFIVADAYTYALPDPTRALLEATIALYWGLDTPRIHAILASANAAEGELAIAAYHLDRHIDLVTTEADSTAALDIGDEVALDLVPGRTYELPVHAVAGQMIEIATESPSEEIGDSILVLLAPNGTPVVGGDDYVDSEGNTNFLARLDWVAPTTGTYLLRVTSFESVGTGELVVTRD